MESKCPHRGLGQTGNVGYARGGGVSMLRNAGGGGMQLSLADIMAELKRMGELGGPVAKNSDKKLR